MGAAAAWQAVTSPRRPARRDLVPPVVGIKAGAGSARPGAALEQIAAIPGVEQMNVEIYVPDHRLAEELAERSAERGAAGAHRLPSCGCW